FFSIDTLITEIYTLSLHDALPIYTQNIHEFVNDVEKATDGDLKINVHSAGSLIKHQEIKNAVRSKQVEIGEFIISNLANEHPILDRKSTRLNSSHVSISYAVFCLK